MLKAFLRRKLRWSLASDETGEEASLASGREPAKSEDPLTSAVFGRFAYLEPPEAWALLRQATAVLHGAELPERVPEGRPAWSFWPKLLVGELGHNAHYVEPDVLVAWGEVVIVIEAKHQGGQWSAQWVEEIRAARASHPGAGLWFLAAGGLEPGDGARLAAESSQSLGEDAASILAMRWEQLCLVLHARRSAASSVAVTACLDDIAAALEAWGYRLRLGFDTLPGALPSGTISAKPGDIPSWKGR